jgi:hypothetical protein
MRWMIEHLSLYSIKIDTSNYKEKSLIYMDKLLEKNPNSDDILFLFMEKGFILWSLNKTELTIELFSLKIKNKYKDGHTFKEKIKSRYKYYTNSQTIILPKQKDTWKQIKKLK